MALDPKTLDQLLDSVDRFVRDTLVPAEGRLTADSVVPEDIIAKMRELGLFGYAIPEEYGGLGLTSREETELVFRFTQAAVVFRNIVGTNNGIGSRGIIVAGTAQQKAKYLTRIASGELITSFALTEPDTGSDAASIKTTARRQGGKWILNGTKRFISNAPYAGLFTIFARTGTPEQGARGVSAFLVERNAPGLSFGKPDRKMGHWGSQTCDVVMTDCTLDEDALLGQEGRGFRMAMSLIDGARVGIGAICVGMGERIIREALAYAMERRQFGTAIANFQLIQAMLADSRAELSAAKAMVRETADLLDTGADVSMEAACCKMFASEAVGRIADRAVQIHGGAGYMAEYAVERLYRDVRLFRIYEGTTQIQQLTIAKHMLSRAMDGK